MTAVIPTEGGEPVIGPSLEGSGQLGGFSPGDLRSAYGLPSSGGAGQTVAITIAYDDPNAESDLAVYRSHYGLSPCTTANGCFKKVNQLGKEGKYPEPNSGWALETSLDLDMVSATCPACHILLVEADSNYVEDLGAAVDKAVEIGCHRRQRQLGRRRVLRRDRRKPLLPPSGHPGSLRFRRLGLWRLLPRLVARHDRRRWNQPDGIRRRTWLVRDDLVGRRQRLQQLRGKARLAERRRVRPADRRRRLGRRQPADARIGVRQLRGIRAGCYWGGPASRRRWSPASRASPRAPSAPPAQAGSRPRATTASSSTSSKAKTAPAPPKAIPDSKPPTSARPTSGYDGPTGWGSPDGAFSLPVAVTESATVESTEKATLHGAVDPKGSPTEYRFEYGETTAYGTSVPIPDESVGAGSEYADVAQTIKGLKGQTPYHFRIVAIGSGKTFPGIDRTFGTTPPTVSTGAADEIHASSATLHATVIPEGLDSTYYFEYGSTTSYGHKAPVKVGTLSAATKTSK